MLDPTWDKDPAKGVWAGRASWIGVNQKQMPLLREPCGDVVLQANAAQGVRKWTVCECLCMPGVAAAFHPRKYRSESEFPR